MGEAKRSKEANGNKIDLALLARGLKTTTMSHVTLDANEKMTGEEMFSMIGGIEDLDIAPFIQACKGLNPYWNCLEKAIIVQKGMQSGHVVMGSLYVWNDKMNAQYGYAWNPPKEFHAWWQPNLSKKAPIIDIALPGVIAKGSTIRDEQGLILTGREPVILAGYPPFWLEYDHKIIFTGN